ncbi:MAG: hypothetical protein WBC77_01845 [Candidatus Zixiibacteriota bacterium]
MVLKSAHCERLASYLYSIAYRSVESEIDNPVSHGGLYPDSLDWSPGGDVKFGLQAAIACNKGAREYLVTELIGVRAGIRNVSDSAIELGFAYYSPDKHGIPPDYTLSIEGPHNYPRVIGYLGDDALYGGPRTKLQNMVSIPAGSVFNPSFDSLFYNSSDGLFSFEAPGTYRLWFTYSFDSLTSSLLVPLTLIPSDTIELQVIAPEFIESEKLAKFLPRNIDGFKSGKPEVHNRLLNPHWTESLQYPSAWNFYFQREGDFSSPNIGVFIIDSGCIRAIVNRWSGLDTQADAVKATLKGFPACKLYESAREGRKSIALITVIVAHRIVVRISGHGVQMEEAENAAGAVDYAAIVKGLKP